MIPYLEAQLVGLTPEVQRSVVREYLQMRILESLQRAGAMIPLAFHGGTALRFLYHIPRYSEDLDFALERQHEQYDFRAYLQTIRRDLAADTYTVEVRINDRKVVHSAFVRFRGLLHVLGITPHHDEVLAIKLEVDTNPPAGALLDTTLVRHHVDVHLQHHDPSSLLAGKLHTILQRTYSKGRDWFDLHWYLYQPQWPLPNFTMLNNALAQSGWGRDQITEANWRAYTRERLQRTDWSQVVADIERFVMEQEYLPTFTSEQILQKLQ